MTGRSSPPVSGKSPLGVTARFTGRPASALERPRGARTLAPVRAWNSRQTQRAARVPPTIETRLAVARTCPRARTATPGDTLMMSNHVVDLAETCARDRSRFAQIMWCIAL